MQLKNWMWTSAVIIGLAGCNAGGSQSVKLDLENNEEQKVAYSYGVYTAQNMTNQGFEGLDQEAFMQGVKDKMAEGDLLVSEDSIFPILQAYSQKQAMAAAEKNKTDGEAFLAENKTKEGVVTTESGLQYQVIEEGEGESPTKEDTVVVHYEGTLIDGTVFDSSYKKGEPITFPVGGVIPGWTEALQLMKPGAKWKLFIPSDLAYGNQARSQVIKPNSTLLFEVELLEVKKAQN